MDDSMVDRLARRIAGMASRRMVVRQSLATVAAAFGAMDAVAGAGAATTKTKPPEPPKGPQCVGAAQLCATTADCCPETTGRICAQNGCAIPDRPRCCAGIGQPCRGGCQCCGPDLECVDLKCAYRPR